MKTLFGDLNVSRLTIPFLFAWMLLETSARADALDYWLPSYVVTNPPGLFSGLGLRGVTYGNGRFMVAGEYASDEGFVQTSEDGVSWTLHRPGVSNLRDLYDVAYGSNTFVGVGWGGLGTPNIFSSSSGDIWGQISTASANVNRVIYGGGRFVALGDPRTPNGSLIVSNIYSSPDGFNWTAHSSGAPTNGPYWPSDVTYGNNVYAAIAGQYLHLSPDASFWIRRTNSLSGVAISFCKDRFIISTGAGTNLFSFDGANWTLLTNNTGVAFGRVVYGDGYYVTVTASNVVTSTDATNWIVRPMQFPTNTYWRSLTFGNHKFLVVGNAPVGPVVYYSDLAMPTINLTLMPGLLPTLSLTGIAGRNYRIEQHTNLQATNWQTVATFTLTNNPFIWVNTPATNSARYYRAALLP